MLIRVHTGQLVFFGLSYPAFKCLFLQFLDTYCWAILLFFSLPLACCILTVYLDLPFHSMLPSFHCSSCSYLCLSCHAKSYHYLALECLTYSCLFLPYRILHYHFIWQLSCISLLHLTLHCLTKLLSNMLTNLLLNKLSYLALSCLP